MTSPTTSGASASTRTAYVLVFDGLADWEPAHALVALRRSPRHRVVTVGFTSAPVTTMGGLRILPDATLDEVDPEGAAILILPGGELWEQDPEAGRRAGLHALLERFRAAGVPIGAICGATLEAVRAGLTDGVRHTSNAEAYLQAMLPDYADTADYVDALAVRDHGLITAGAIGSLEFAREVMRELELTDDAEIDVWYALFKHGTPPPQYAAQGG